MGSRSPLTAAGTAADWPLPFQVEGATAFPVRLRLRRTDDGCILAEAIRGVKTLKQLTLAVISTATVRGKAEYFARVSSAEQPRQYEGRADAPDRRLFCGSFQLTC